MLECRVLTYKKRLLKDKVRSITIPAFGGELQILPDHAESFFLLKQGEIKLILQKGAVKTIPVKAGVLHVKENKVVILI